MNPSLSSKVSLATGFPESFPLVLLLRARRLLVSVRLKELFLLFLKVNCLSAFAHAAWRVWAEAEEVTEDIILILCFLDLSGSIPSSSLRRRGWALLVIISNDMLVARWVNHGLSLLHVSNRRHQILVNGIRSQIAGR